MPDGRKRYAAAALTYSIEFVCIAFSAGNIGDPGEDGRRLVRVACFDAAGTSNFWARPIEGVVAVVDLDERRVIRLIDTGPVKFGARER